MTRHRIGWRTRRPGHIIGGVAFLCWVLAWGGCQCQPRVTPDGTGREGAEIHTADGRHPTDGTSLDAPDTASPDPTPTDAPDASDAAGDAGQPWENRPITPWDGPPLDGGVPEDYPWEKGGGGFAQRVIAFHPTSGASHGHSDFPAKIKGPPQGLGDAKGSLHVVSLGCGGSIVLEFSSPLIGNGPGPDFVIFENGFFPGGGKETFAEPAQVSVSIDGHTWFSYPCEPDKSSWPYPSCAGINPVYAHPNNQIDPHEPKAAGGDVFDLDDVGLPYARFLKIEDRSQLSPDAAIWCGAYNAGFDLDAVGVIWGFHPR